jgi:hypothetical protein
VEAFELDLKGFFGGREGKGRKEMSKGTSIRKYIKCLEEWKVA